MKAKKKQITKQRERALKAKWEELTDHEAKGPPFKRFLNRFKKVGSVPTMVMENNTIIAKSGGKNEMTYILKDVTPQVAVEATEVMQ